MGRRAKDPKREVVSMRITDEEKSLLVDKALRLKVSVADLLHEAAQQAGLFARREA